MNNTVFTSLSFVDPYLQDNDAMVVADGKIMYIGRSNDYQAAVTGDYQVRDVHNLHVSAGFIDTHTHFLSTGLHQHMIPLFECVTLEALLDCLDEGKREQGDCIRGYGFDESLFPDKRKPSMADLDRISHSRPMVIFRRDYHSCVVNSRLLEELSVPADLICSDTDRGLFRGRANDWVRQALFWKISTSERFEALKSATDLAFSRGVTSVHALEGGSLFGLDDLDFLIETIDSWPLRIVLYPQITDSAWVRAHRVPRMGGCLLIDGSFGSSTAALSEPYAGEPENRGVLYFDDDTLNALVETAHKEGLQLSFHAIGDRAITQLVNAYEKALLRYPRSDHRHRIEHCELPTPRDMERIARLGLSLAVQPVFEYLWGGPGKMYHHRLGAERMGRTNPFRDFLENGILMGGGSDSDVTPLDPLQGIQAAVTHPRESQRLTPADALLLYTEKAARMAFLENETGSLRPGKAADFVVLSADPLCTRSDEIKDIKVLETFSGGKSVYSAREETLCQKNWKLV